MKKALPDGSEATLVSSDLHRFGSGSGYLDNESVQLTTQSNIESQYDIIGGQDVTGGLNTSAEEAESSLHSPQPQLEASSQAEVTEFSSKEPGSPQPSTTSPKPVKTSSMMEEMVADLEKVWHDDILGSSGLLPQLVDVVKR